MIKPVLCNDSDYLATLTHSRQASQLEVQTVVKPIIMPRGSLWAHHYTSWPMKLRNKNKSC